MRFFCAFLVDNDMILALFGSIVVLVATVDSKDLGQPLLSCLKTQTVGQALSKLGGSLNSLFNVIFGCCQGLPQTECLVDNLLEIIGENNGVLSMEEIVDHGMASDPKLLLKIAKASGSAESELVKSFENEINWTKYFRDT